MFNSETLEVAIGMSFLFLAVALICASVREGLEGVLKWRAMDLERGLRTLLGDPDGALTAELLRHPLLDGLFAGQYDPAALRGAAGAKRMPWSRRRHLPSYIPSGHFARAFLDLVARGPVADPADAAATDTAPLTVAELRQRAAGLASPGLQRALLTALDHSGEDLAAARRNIEQWFDGTMERVSGWYKRRTQAVLFLLGLAMAAGMDIDAFHVMERLTTDKAFRAAVVHESGSALAPAEAASASALTRVVVARQALEDVAVPFGWRSSTVKGWPVPVQQCLSGAAGSTCTPAGWRWSDWLTVVAGWLATAFAAMLGAPFWFDMLGRFTAVRSTMKPAAVPADASPGGRPAKAAAA